MKETTLYTKTLPASALSRQRSLPDLPYSITVRVKYGTTVVMTLDPKER